MEDYIINVKIEKEDELYNKFDSENQTLSDDFISYIKDKINEAYMKQNIIININSDETIDEDNAKKVWKKYMDTEMKKLDREKRSNRIKQIWLIIVGIIFISISIAVGAKFDTIIVEILSIIGSFAIWETTDIWLIENKSINFKILECRKIMNSKITFNNK